MTTVWNIDASHSHANFSVRHLMISNVRGEFRTLAGKVTFSPDAPEQAVVEAEVEVASIHTREDKRDEHLRSADFFDAANFPKITFKSTSIKRDGDDLALTGDLTIRGTTKPVTFQVEALSPEQTDPWGGKRVGTSATAKIKRSDFGITWNAALETGGVVVGDEIKIALDIELVKAAG
jgi:polyisoprenoid-binding protein YceI